MGNNTIRIERFDDFAMLARDRLGTVVDPMVFRAGELFLRGRKGLRQQPRQLPLDDEAAWDFLDKNLEALRFFFDVLVLHEHLPLFNYSDTFDRDANFDERSLAVINQASQDAVLVPVNVQYGTYAAVKMRAVEKLGEHLARAGGDTRAWADPALASSIARELSRSGYRWEPRSPEIEAELATEQDRVLVRFLLGGMIFGQYADLMDSEHWLQPKRARLFVRATIDGGPVPLDDERQLFERLGTQYRLPFGRRWQPTFLHYILARANTRADIPGIVAKLRKSGAVKDYRAWRARAIAEWQRKGGISAETEDVVKGIKAALGAQGVGVEDVQDATVAWVDTAAAAAAAPEPTAALVGGAAAAVLKTAPPAWDFVRGLWPGRRHVKLLAESLRMRQHYPQIERAVATLWND